MIDEKVPPIFVKTNAPRKKRLRLAAALTERDMSDIAREGIDEKLDKLARRFPALDRQKFTQEAA